MNKVMDQYEINTIYEEYKRDVWGKGISMQVYMKELIKEDLVVHPKIIID